MDVFDIIGPVMIGPSSSHTAGAVRLGAIARELLGAAPVRATISLYGSFSKTYKGHGTDKAIVGGLLGMSMDDPALKNSLQAAASAGLDCRVKALDEKCGHPNAALIEAEGNDGEKVSVLGFSVGGGNVLIKKLNGIDVEFTGRFNTLIVPHFDLPGTVAAITGILGDRGVNIALMRVYRSKQRGESIMIIETDQKLCEEIKTEIGMLSSVKGVRIVAAIK